MAMSKERIALARDLAECLSFDNGLLVKKELIAEVELLQKDNDSLKRQLKASRFGSDKPESF